MTQQERDEELRLLRQRYSTARETWSASLSKLTRYGNTLADIGNGLQMLRADASLQETGIDIPDQLPTASDIKRLQSELAKSLKEMRECQNLLAGFGIHEN